MWIDLGLEKLQFRLHILRLELFTVALMSQPVVDDLRYGRSCSYQKRQRKDVLLMKCHILPVHRRSAKKEIEDNGLDRSDDHHREQEQTDIPDKGLLGQVIRNEIIEVEIDDDDIEEDIDQVFGDGMDEAVLFIVEQDEDHHENAPKGDMPDHLHRENGNELRGDMPLEFRAHKSGFFAGPGCF